MKNKRRDPNDNWDRIWKRILQKPDGSIDIEQLKLELSDFSELMDRMITLTHPLSGGKLSYATYSVDTIMGAAYEVYEDGYGCPVCGEGLSEE